MKMLEHRAREAPTTLLVAAGSHVGIQFQFIFGSPKLLKIVLSLWRGATFYQNGMTRPGAPNGPPNDSKI